jgi:hypothetical protein
VHESIRRFYKDEGQAFPGHLPGDMWLLKLLGELTNTLHPCIDFYSLGYTTNHRRDGNRFRCAGGGDPVKGWGLDWPIPERGSCRFGVLVHAGTDFRHQCMRTIRRDRRDNRGGSPRFGDSGS